MAAVTVTSYYRHSALQGFPGGSDGKEFACNAWDLGSIPGMGRSSGKRNGYPVCYSCLENPHGPGGLQFTGSPRIRHKWATNTFTSAYLLSYAHLLMTPWTVACQAPLSMGICQETILEWVAMPSREPSQPRRTWRPTHLLSYECGSLISNMGLIGLKSRYP